MNDLQLRLHLRGYTIKSSFSGPPSPEEPFPSPHTFQPQPRIFPSAHWHTSPHVVKTVLLALLLAGFTLMALLAYSSPLPSPASLHNDPTPSSGDNPLAPVISTIAFSLKTLHALPPGLNTIDTDPGLDTVHTDPGMLSTHENLSNSTHSDADSQGS